MKHRVGVYVIGPTKTEQGIQQQHQQHLVMMTRWTVKQLNEIFHNNTDIL